MNREGFIIRGAVVFESFDYAQLNPDAKKYLADVRRSGGRGLPGVYMAVGDNRPLWAVLVGLCILPVFLWIGYTSSKDPWATAMLQTAGVLLGGWLVAYGIRRWMAGINSYAGYFAYFDSDHAFLGEGETIRIARIVPEAKVAPHGAKSVLISTELDEQLIEVPNRLFAERVADFYHALAWVRTREDGLCPLLKVDEAGAVARHLADEDEMPQNVAEADLRIGTMTDDVRSVGRSKTGILGLLAWVGIGAAAYAFFFSTNGFIQDDLAFAAAKDNIGKDTEEKYTGAQGLRDYLLNDRNTRHREEATQLLAGLYDAPIAQVKSNPSADPELRDGMAALLHSLRGPETPAVSIAVIDTNSPFQTNLSKGLRTRFADGIAMALGKDLIAFGEAPADKPALFKVRYSRANATTVDWIVDIRLKPDDAAVYQSKGSASFVGAAGTQATPFGPTVELATSETDALTEAVYSAVMLRLLGQVPAKPAAVTNEDW